MSVLIFLLVLFVLILVHEWGHFIVAKKSDMRVDEFGIGFPPRLWGVKKGETLYSINALPIGGFVKIFGENAVTADGASDTSRSFMAKSHLAQAAVLVAGVGMNILLAWFLFVVVLMIGVPTGVDESNAGPGAQLVVTEVINEGPAGLAAIPPGATILALESGALFDQTLSPTSFANFISNSAEEPVSLTYLYQDEEVTAVLKPEAGVITGEPDRVAVGMVVTLVETVKEPIFSAMIEATVRVYETLIAITVGLGSLLVDAVTFDADLSQVAGPVGIVGLVGDAAAFGLTSLLTFTAVISLNLAVINMLPLPALDGGRLLFVAIEAVIRRPINPVWVARLNFAGFAFLILLMVAVTYNDVLRII